MSIVESSGPIHPQPTRRSSYRYLFYNKHHGYDDRASRWTLSQDEEFAVFDTADFHDLSDDRGWLYGVRPHIGGRIPELGTEGQQLAEFPSARDNEPWHGYPLWPLKDKGPENRRGEKRRPSRDVFQRMEDEGLLTPRDRKRLWKGNRG